MFNALSLPPWALRARARVCVFYSNELLFINADSTSRLQEDRVCGEGEEPVCRVSWISCLLLPKC